MVIGNKITELRKKYNLTQEALSEKIGVTRQTLSNWESNITSPDLEQASLLCKELKINLNDLVDNNLEIEVKENNNVLSHLINKNVYLEIDYEEYYDMDISITTLVKVLSVSDDFIKVEYTIGKDVVTKLIDLDMIESILMVEED